MSAVSDKVLSISVEYLGPAAKVFLERQTVAHMGGIPFDSIENRHVPDLKKWVFSSAILIIEEGKAKELSERIGQVTC